MVHPSRALSGRKEEIENKNSVLRFFFPPQFQCIGTSVYAIGGSKARNPFFFFQLIKKGLQVFDLPILINKNPNAPDLWKKKTQ